MCEVVPFFEQKCYHPICKRATAGGSTLVSTLPRAHRVCAPLARTSTRPLGLRSSWNKRVCQLRSLICPVDSPCDSSKMVRKCLTRGTCCISWGKKMGLVHEPCWNAAETMLKCCAMVKMDSTTAQNFQVIADYIQKLAAGQSPREPLRIYLPAPANRISDDLVRSVCVQLPWDEFLK